MALITVEQMPDELKIGTVLTDGKDKFKAVDRHYRDGALWFELVNLKEPEKRGWFQLAEIGPLFFEKDPRVRRARHRHGVMRRPR